MGNSDGRSILNALAGVYQEPTTEHEWWALENAISQLFTPHGPIDEDALFAGRFEITNNVIDVVFQKGCHAIIYGERGVGKTSFANILRDKIFSKTTAIKVIKRNCTARHNFHLIWRQVLDDYDIEGKTSDKFIPDGADAYAVVKALKLIEFDEMPVIIVDEFDRVRDSGTYEEMADLLKYLSDEGLNSTVIVVGVGESVHELFGSHASIHRNTKQIKMPKMSRPELSAIFDKRLPVLGMAFDTGIREKIIDLSQGFPGYTHLIAQAAFKAAARRREMIVRNADLLNGIQTCVSDADEIIQSDYEKAVRSTKPTHYYKEALTALALTKTSERGFFRAKDVKEPFSMIMGKEMDFPNFNRHLKEFQDVERGPVLIKHGKPKTYEYRFINPLLKPFAILHGIKDNIISMSDYSPS